MLHVLDVVMLGKVVGFLPLSYITAARAGKQVATCLTRWYASCLSRLHHSSKSWQGSGNMLSSTDEPMSPHGVGPWPWQECKICWQPSGYAMYDRPITTE